MAIRKQIGPKVEQKVEQKVDQKVEQKSSSTKIDTLEVFKNKDIEIYTRTGKVLIGRLDLIKQYDIVVTINSLPFVIYKHGIDYIKPVESSPAKE